MTSAAACPICAVAAADRAKPLAAKAGMVIVLRLACDVAALAPAAGRAALDVLAPQRRPPQDGPRHVRARAAAGAGRTRLGATGASTASWWGLGSRLRHHESIDELLAGARTPEQITGPQGLLQRLTKRLVERAMAAELSEHFGYEHGEAPPSSVGNARSGMTPKTIAAGELKVWAHKITPERDSEGIPARVDVHLDQETRHFDLALSCGQVTLALPGGSCRVEITLARRS